MANQSTNPLQDARQPVPTTEVVTHSLNAQEEELHAVADVDWLLRQARPHALPNRERNARSIMDKIATRQLPVAQPHKSARALAFSLTVMASFCVIMGTLLVLAGWLIFNSGILLSALAQVLVGLVGMVLAFVRLVTQVMTHTLAQYPLLGAGVVFIPLAIIGLRRLCSGKNEPHR